MTLGGGAVPGTQRVPGAAPSHVVLLHGIQSGPTTWWRVGHDLRTLGFRVTAPTLPGNAGRAMTDQGSLQSLADAVATWDGPALVVGHSLGALVALRLTERRPDLVAALVLEDPPAQAAVDPALLAADLAAQALEARSDPEAVRVGLLAEHPSWAVEDAVHAVANRAAVRDDAAMPLARETWDLPRLVTAAGVPVTVLAATEGSLLPEPDRARVLAAADAVVEVESGHGVHRDRPGVWVGAVVAAAGSALPPALG